MEHFHFLRRDVTLCRTQSQGDIRAGRISSSVTRQKAVFLIYRILYHWYSEYCVPHIQTTVSLIYRILYSSYTEYCILDIQISYKGHRISLSNFTSKDFSSTSCRTKGSKLIIVKEIPEFCYWYCKCGFIHNFTLLLILMFSEKYKSPPPTHFPGLLVQSSLQISCKLNKDLDANSL